MLADLRNHDHKNEVWYNFVKDLGTLKAMSGKLSQEFCTNRWRENLPSAQNKTFSGVITGN